MKRLTTTLIICFCLCITAFAQGRGVTLNLNNESLTNALKRIEKMGEKNILFAYKETEKYRVSTNFQCKTQREALEIVLNGKPFDFVERNTYFAVQYTGKVAQTEYLKGKVYDEHHQPLGFANVVMLSTFDKSYITGCVTADDGSFVLPYSNKDTFLQISFVGYKTQTVTAKTHVNITMKSETHQLNAVTIKHTRPSVEYKNGAFVSRVAGTVLSEMGTAEDLIGHLPFVTGENGDWNIIGRGTPEIYLNGRKIRDTKDLKSLSAKEILKAEVITAPGARYSSSTGAVIRLYAVKQRGQGLSGSLYSQYTQGHYSPKGYENAKLNYRIGGLDIFGELGFDQNKYHGISNTTTRLDTNHEWTGNSSTTQEGKT